jgi:hypothetical protein
MFGDVQEVMQNFRHIPFAREGIVSYVRYGEFDTVEALSVFGGKRAARRFLSAGRNGKQIRSPVPSRPRVDEIDSAC